jgi:TfoX/Sxy family transcriptional regulator of competence genes
MTYIYSSGSQNRQDMPFDTVLADRIRIATDTFPAPLRRDVTEKKMFGGLAFLLKGKMTVGIIGNELMVRVVEEKMEDILANASVRPMDFTNRPMKEFVFVSPEAFETDGDLRKWVSLGIEHARRKLNL